MRRYAWLTASFDDVDPESIGVRCCHAISWSVRWMRLSELASIRFHWLRSSFFTSRKYFSAFASASSLLSEAPGAFSASLWLKASQRTVGLQLDRKFFRLAVAEIAHLPDRAGHFGGINFVQARDAHALAKKFVGDGVGEVREDSRRAIRVRIEAALAHNFIGASGFAVRAFTESFR